MVEGGATTLQSFINANLWDEIRIETAPVTVAQGTSAPKVPQDLTLIHQCVYGGNIIDTFYRAAKKECTL